MCSQIAPLTIGMLLAWGGIAPLHAQQRDEMTTESGEAAMQESPAHDDQAQDADRSAVREAESGHVAPPPPSRVMDSMDAHEMTRVMEMDDSAPLAMLKLDRFERDVGDDAATAWKLSAWVGGDFDKILVRSEGERARGEFDHADAEMLWDHAVVSFWDAQVGVRHDFGVGTDRNWAAFGVQGVAPYWFGIEATTYVGDAGRSALRLEVDYDLSLTQRLILQPRVELNAYGKADPAAHVGTGLSDAQIGLRLRYEIRREIAPYIGIEQVRRFGTTASMAESDGENGGETRWVAGLRIWY